MAVSESGGHPRCQCTQTPEYIRDDNSRSFLQQVEEIGRLYEKRGVCKSKEDCLHLVVTCYTETLLGPWNKINAFISRFALTLVPRPGILACIVIPNVNSQLMTKCNYHFESVDISLVTFENPAGRVAHLCPQEFTTCAGVSGAFVLDDTLPISASPRSASPSCPSTPRLRPDMMTGNPFIVETQNHHNCFGRFLQSLCCRHVASKPSLVEESSKMPNTNVKCPKNVHTKLDRSFTINGRSVQRRPIPVKEMTCEEKMYEYRPNLPSGLSLKEVMKHYEEWLERDGMTDNGACDHELREHLFERWEGMIATELSLADPPPCGCANNSEDEDADDDDDNPHDVTAVAHNNGRSSTDKERKRKRKKAISSGKARQLTAPKTRPPTTFKNTPHLRFQISEDGHQLRQEFIFTSVPSDEFGVESNPDTCIVWADGTRSEGCKLPQYKLHEDTIKHYVDHLQLRSSSQLYEKLADAVGKTGGHTFGKSRLGEADAVEDDFRSLEIPLQMLSERLALALVLSQTAMTVESSSGRGETAANVQSHRRLMRQLHGALKTIEADIVATNSNSSITAGHQAYLESVAHLLTLTVGVLHSSFVLSADTKNSVIASPLNERCLVEERARGNDGVEAHDSVASKSEGSERRICSDSMTTVVSTRKKRPLLIHLPPTLRFSTDFWQSQVVKLINLPTPHLKDCSTVSYLQNFASSAFSLLPSSMSLFNLLLPDIFSADDNTVPDVTKDNDDNSEEDDDSEYDARSLNYKNVAKQLGIDPQESQDSPSSEEGVNFDASLSVSCKGLHELLLGLNHQFDEYDESLQKITQQTNEALSQRTERYHPTVTIPMNPSNSKNSDSHVDASTASLKLNVTDDQIQQTFDQQLTRLSEFLRFESPTSFISTVMSVLTKRTANLQRLADESFSRLAESNLKRSTKLNWRIPALVGMFWSMRRSGDEAITCYNLATFLSPPKYVHIPLQLMAAVAHFSGDRDAAFLLLNAATIHTNTIGSPSDRRAMSMATASYFHTTHYFRYAIPMYELAITKERLSTQPLATTAIYSAHCVLERSAARVAMLKRRAARRKVSLSDEIGDSDDKDDIDDSE